MSNLLNDAYDISGQSFLTPVFPVPTNYKSSLHGDALVASPRLVVKNTDSTITKDGDTITINGIKVDVGHKNILDIVNLFKQHGIDVKFLDNTHGWDLPAACILDFTNKEYIETNLTHLPFDLDVKKIIKNKSIETIAEVYIKPELVFDVKGNQKSFKCNSNFITEVSDFGLNIKLLYSVHSDSFLIKVYDNKFTTTKKDVLAKHIDKVIK